jgi:hypothetical protein
MPSGVLAWQCQLRLDSLVWLESLDSLDSLESLNSGRLVQGRFFNQGSSASFTV